MAKHFSGNLNESNRADIDTFHDDRGDAYSTVDPVKPVEKEGGGTVDNIASQIVADKRRKHNKTAGIFYRPPTKLREGNVFTRVCLFTGEGGPM